MIGKFMQSIRKLFLIGTVALSFFFMNTNYVSAQINKKGNKDSVVIENVPAYLWRHGCVPTAAGMLLGYYDLKYPMLVPGDAQEQTEEVNQFIASDEHYLDYSCPIDTAGNLKKDKSILPEQREPNCLADFMKTSWYSEGSPYGSTIGYNAVSGLYKYIASIDSNFVVDIFWGGRFDSFTKEIDEQRPLLMSIDYDGDFDPEHTVIGVGYNKKDSTYAFYGGGDRNLHWNKWKLTADLFGVPDSLKKGPYIFGTYTFKLNHTLIDTGVYQYKDNNQTLEKKLIVFPNPAEDYLFIKSNMNLDDINYEIFDLQGRVVESNRLTNKKINLNNLNSGVYILRFSYGNGSEAIKFVKR